LCAAIEINSDLNFSLCSHSSLAKILDRFGLYNLDINALQVKICIISELPLLLKYFFCCIQIPDSTSIVIYLINKDQQLSLASLQELLKLVLYLTKYQRNTSVALIDKYYNLCDIRRKKKGKQTRTSYFFF
jgi:predicted transcriptional regulator